MANERGNMFWFPSWKIVVNKVPWYFSMRHVPSTCTIGLK